MVETAESKIENVKVEVDGELFSLKFHQMVVIVHSFYDMCYSCT